MRVGGAWEGLPEMAGLNPRPGRQRQGHPESARHGSSRLATEGRGLRACHGHVHHAGRRLTPWQCLCPQDLVLL